MTTEYIESVYAEEPRSQALLPESALAPFIKTFPTHFPNWHPLIEHDRVQLVFPTDSPLSDLRFSSDFNAEHNIRSATLSVSMKTYIQSDYLRHLPRVASTQGGHGGSFYIYSLQHFAWSELVPLFIAIFNGIRAIEKESKVGHYFSPTHEHRFLKALEKFHHECQGGFSAENATIFYEMPSAALSEKHIDAEVLEDAIKRADVQAVEYFLRAGADPNAFTQDGKHTMLAHAIFFLYFPAYNYYNRLENIPRIVEMLLLWGAEATQVSADGLTPEMFILNKLSRDPSIESTFNEILHLLKIQDKTTLAIPATQKNIEAVQIIEQGNAKIAERTKPQPVYQKLTLQASPCCVTDSFTIGSGYTLKAKLKRISAISKHRPALGIYLKQHLA